MNKHLILILLIGGFLKVNSSYSQTESGGLKFDIYKKSNLKLESVRVYIDEEEYQTLNLDSLGNVPYITLSPGTINVRIESENYETVTILDVTVKSQKLSFQKLLLNPKDKKSPNSSRVIKYQPSKITGCG